MNTLEQLNNSTNLAKTLSDLISNGMFFGAKNLVWDKEVTPNVRKARNWSAQMKVKKHLKGGKLPYNAYNRQLLPVFAKVDKEKYGKDRDYRMINTATLFEVTIKGRRYSRDLDTDSPWVEGKEVEMLSPDGLAIDIEKSSYSSIGAAKQAFNQWRKVYDMQGYYLSNSGRIDTEDLWENMIINSLENVNNEQ